VNVAGTRDGRWGDFPTARRLCSPVSPDGRPDVD
jgi:hypothetical protein